MGTWVYPREVEEVLYEHPAVAEAAVIGIKHADLGEEIGAAVAPQSGVYAEVGEVKTWSEIALRRISTLAES